MILISELLLLVNNNFQIILSLSEKKKFQSAIKKCEKCIQTCKDILKTENDKEGTVKNNTYIFAIFFRGLIDYLNLLQNTSDQQWIRINNRVENVWNTLCDAYDRFSFVSSFLEIDINFLLKEIEDIRQTIIITYGNGLYNSPEIIVESEVCSICNKNPKGCEHTPGHLYFGKLCKIIPTKIKEVRSIAIVENPKDLRCRIWPWNVKEKPGEGRYVTAAIMTAGGIDDFLEED